MMDMDIIFFMLLAVETNLLSHIFLIELIDECLIDCFF